MVTDLDIEKLQKEVTAFANGEGRYARACVCPRHIVLQWEKAQRQRGRQSKEKKPKEKKTTTFDDMLGFDLMNFDNIVAVPEGMRVQKSKRDAEQKNKSDAEQKSKSDADKI